MNALPAWKESQAVHPLRGRPVAAKLRALLGRMIPAASTIMKADTHPNYAEINVTCTCGNTFKTRSTLGHDLQVEVCSSCHPFYTGKQKIVDTAGRVDKFKKRYARKSATPS